MNSHAYGRNPATQCPRRDSLVFAAGLVIALALAGFPADANTTGPGSTEIKVLTYNIKGLPLVTNLDRLERIGEILAERRSHGEESDIVLLQEAYVGQSRQLRQRAGYRHMLVGAEGQRGIFTNSSGLEMLSNFAITASYSRLFDECAFPECFISKGIVGATLEIPGVPVPVQVFNTHLQADSRNDEVRRQQIETIADFLGGLSFGAQPAIFGGDFNFKPRHDSYTKFMRKLPLMEVGYLCLQAALGNCEVEIGTNGVTDWNDVWKSSHDRQFYYQPANGRLRIEPVRLIRNFTKQWRGEFLSDHWGYEVHYRISW
jgi:endonuclease/exonuclease/phosphatase family metal-dependent hydrolase